MKRLFALLTATFISLPLMALEAGDPAPDFTLQASDGHSYSLADYKGKRAVVIAWFPKAFTHGCTIECKSLAENGHLIKDYDVAYFMASTDEADTNAKFAAEHKADFPLLADPSGATAKAYDVRMPLMNIARRITVYIGKDGKVLKVDQDIHPATSAEDIAKTLGELQIPRKS